MNRRISVLIGLVILAFSAWLIWYLFFVGEVPYTKPSAAGIVTRDTDWYPKRDWSNSQPGNMKISVFVYRDRNRDGTYDPQDLPMAAVAVLLERPDGSLRMVRTNINGYANFSVMADSKETDIGEPNLPYTFEIKSPPGWAVTSGNASQSSRFLILGGTPGGMVTENPPAVIGLAPDLMVTGHIRLDSLASEAIVAVGPDGHRIQLALDKDGAFEFLGEPGSWRIALEGETNSRVVHEFEVRDSPVVLGTIDPENPDISAKPLSVVINFDNFHRSVIEKLAHGFQGLAWNYLLAIDNQHYQGPGYVNVLSSGHAVGYNSSGYPVTVSNATSGERFDFVGAYFAVAWPPAEGETLIVEAWRDRRKVYSDTLRLSHLGPIWFQADYRDIESLRLRTEHYWQFTTDDMHYRLP